MSLINARSTSNIFEYFAFSINLLDCRKFISGKMINLRRGRLGAARALLILGIAGGFATAGQASDTLSPALLQDAAQAFDDAALRVNDAQPADLVRWTGPIFLAIADGDGLHARAAEIEASVRTLAAIARVPVSRVAADDPRRNFLVRPAATGGRAACRAAVASQAGRIASAEVEIYLGGRGSLTRCINHEVMHAFGFRSHAHAALSILSYKQSRQTDLSALDRVMIETLYDPRLRPGMRPAEAAPMACAVLAEKLGLSARDAGAQCGSRDDGGQLALFGRRARPN
ncbi:DUF2927 domain-containing protein [Vineibacter terrae]|uniref:DUF2927 domain-containing protein n=1 Tax=Vineibacter terrae TaxID=2586908 RepID=UPI002E344C36|nr:DUF2927 domain-containing protein [Vineibacter terrae]HEX2886068.1 DUF2927 domain-containing protein [Vineibacter terrae]